MMHITCIEVDKFKSFGSPTRIPFLDGFTVISGPNGSGKSNIIDALLFALGLSDSRGLRAGKLSDLIHQGITKGEAVVTVTLGGGDETLTVVRRLRVNGPNCTSTYLLNGRACTLTELHEQLAQRRIYPQGYNVVLQGDVTDIISMHGRERREIIDEMAGVADFDRKINLAKRELDAVQTQEERLRFVESELQQARERLSQERQKAQEYQQLRVQLDTLQAYTELFTLANLEKQAQAADDQLEHLQAQVKANAALHVQVSQDLSLQEIQLAHWQQQVKHLGEEEQLTLQAALTTVGLQYQQTQQQQLEAEQRHIAITQQLTQLDAEEAQIIQGEQELNQAKHHLESQLVQLREQLLGYQHQLEQRREELRLLSQSSDAWVQQQTQLNQQLQTLQAALSPLQQTLTRLAERLAQQHQQRADNRQETHQLEQEFHTQTQQLDQHTQAVIAHTQTWEELRAQLTQRQGMVLTDKSTLRRLEKEHQQLRRELDQIEARQQVSRELDGQTAVQVILRANLPGVHGPIVHLAQVPTEYQLALEIAAGGRLFNMVVDDDEVGAQAIELLKQQRAGRATLLPLAQLRDPAHLYPLREEGFVGYALHLLEFAPRFLRAFGYVFGDTVVFNTMDTARRHLGRYRIVTLAGEIFEKSGAMTGGSVRTRSGNLWRGTSEIPHAQQARLNDLEAMIRTLAEKLERQEQHLQTLQQQAQQAERLSLHSGNQQQQAQRETRRLQQRLDQLQEQQMHLNLQHEQDQQAQRQGQAQLAPLEAEITAIQQKLTELKTYSVYQEWQALQRLVQDQDQHRQRTQQAVFDQESQLQKQRTHQHLAQERLKNLTTQRHTFHQQTESLAQQILEFVQQLDQQKGNLAQLQAQWQTLEETLRAAKHDRDHWEALTHQSRRQIQTCTWQQEQVQMQIEQHHQSLQDLAVQLAQQTDLCAQYGDLTLPPTLTPEQLHHQRQKVQRRLTALEPVNMLAIEEYDQTEARLGDLTTHLDTLTRERTELLLRIETLDTRKRNTFMTAFDAVNEHFQRIFADLSDGDGHLQLDDPENPFAGGLTLVAHPKGKKIRRLESMSGGEKSLTALSFIFALQRYRPSPFYAFDEVDMFLDGANVERLAHMLQQSAQSAQFIVVSLRRPMIERADRTIGVTLGKDQQSQVLGMKPIRAQLAKTHG